MSNAATQKVTQNAIPGKAPLKEYPLRQDTIALAHKLQMQGYGTRFYHRKAGDYDFPTETFFEEMPVEFHLSKATIVITESADVGVHHLAIFHPKLGLPIYVTVNQDGMVGKAEVHKSDYAEHYNALEEILADHFPGYIETDTDSAIAVLATRRYSYPNSEAVAKIISALTSNGAVALAAPNVLNQFYPLVNSRLHGRSGRTTLEAQLPTDFMPTDKGVKLNTALVQQIACRILNPITGQEAGWAFVDIDNTKSIPTLNNLFPNQSMVTDFNPVVLPPVESDPAIAEIIDKEESEPAPRKLYDAQFAFTGLGDDLVVLNNPSVKVDISGIAEIVFDTTFRRLKLVSDLTCELIAPEGTVANLILVPAGVIADSTFLANGEVKVTRDAMVTPVKFDDEFLKDKVGIKSGEDTAGQWLDVYQASLAQAS